jgi:hypothetical protein
MVTRAGRGQKGEIAVMGGWSWWGRSKWRRLVGRWEGWRDRWRQQKQQLMMVVVVVWTLRQQRQLL